MIENPKIARDNLILENGAIRDVNARAVVGDDDHGTSQRNSCSKSHVSRHCQMIQFLQVQLVVGSKKTRYEGG